MGVSKWIPVLSFFYLAGCNISGCSLFNTEPFVDAKTDEDGNVTLLDTARNWQDWREAVDPQIASEIAGMPAPGFPTWHEKWSRQLKALQETQENAPKYIAYIIEKRRLAGLSDLEGYP